MTAHRTPPQRPIESDKQAAAQPIGLRVIKGALVPATDDDIETLRRFRLRVGHLVIATLDRPRHPEGLRVLHGFAQLISQNIEGFEHLTAHQVIKRLQAESGVGCHLISVSARDAISALLPSLGDDIASAIDFNKMGDHLVNAYQPKSLSAATMDDAEFQEIFDGLARFVALRYWPSMTPEQIQETAGLMPESVP
ncbi:hypothetical protein [Marinobacter subterrani]|uniref:hypothetical protein n=1 Tax=Marinobacter subterrani TaxID=1658765 RepID=UPI002353C831|nr:hypothetical protein [Marinobacter subterrani]